MSPEYQLQPQFSFVIECTLARDNMIRFERVNCVGDNYSLIWDVARHHCRFLIKEGYRIVESEKMGQTTHSDRHKAVQNPKT